jgi:hypothetical protein
MIPISSMVSIAGLLSIDFRLLPVVSYDGVRWRSAADAEGLALVARKIPHAIPRTFEPGQAMLWW